MSAQSSSSMTVGSTQIFGTSGASTRLTQRQTKQYSSHSYGEERWAVSFASQRRKRRPHSSPRKLGTSMTAPQKAECNEFFGYEIEAYARLRDCQGRSMPRMYFRTLISPLAPLDLKKWLAIVQSAADAAHDINRRGVVMKDCGPCNVVVDKHLQTPFIIDLTQC
ncbi:hypothetical protein QBC33DRAFT_513429 [Phialemonium atrogriseum]|uniref:Protein kinase domain-containing protein n=1 Tax=Phialemonium atrogriseum TaxID=1093897 RepID=A0AAJ0FIU0_9PEZI|nr:uncharacterized protein QBC33DRAFT_513429 [Phialemonium atrogriseum]KAK1769197.1 hypothetical protein QBC33DRAFT_513429 [Phialemonium atrogriseum]